MFATKSHPENTSRPTADGSIMRLERIYRYYDSGAGRAFVLNGISLDIRKGEFVSIMGPSGAGKSTLLHILGMLDRADEGAYHFLERDVTRLKEKDCIAIHKRSIGFVFQSYHLLDDLTVYENLETPLLYKGVARSERKALVGDTLDRFQIVGKKDLFPAQLFGGQQQLVGVARAVITNPVTILRHE